MRKFLRKRRGVQGSLPWMERLLLTAPGSVRRVRSKALPVRGAGAGGLARVDAMAKCSTLRQLSLQSCRIGREGRTEGKGAN